MTQALRQEGVKDMELLEIGMRARAAEPQVRNLTTTQKNQLLTQCASDLQLHAEEILEANARDMAKGRENGMSQGSGPSAPDQSQN